MSRVVRVLIADDHPVARSGVAALLASHPNVEVVGTASNGAEALALYPKLRPDVVIADLRMPVLDGVALTRALRAADPNARVLVFTHYDGDEQVYQALRAGAMGYLTKDSDADVLVEALTTIADGGRFVPADLAGRFAHRVTQPSLSPREQQVLPLVAEGLTNREIASRLGLTERTAALHVGNLLAKLGAKTRAEAVALAVKTGLLPDR